MPGVPHGSVYLTGLKNRAACRSAESWIRSCHLWQTLCADASNVCISVLTKIISKISDTRKTLCGSADAMVSRECDY